MRNTTCLWSTRAEKRGEHAQEDIEFNGSTHRTSLHFLMDWVRHPSSCHALQSLECQSSHAGEFISDISLDLENSRKPRTQKVTDRTPTNCWASSTTRWSWRMRPQGPYRKGWPPCYRCLRLKLSTHVSDRNNTAGWMTVKPPLWPIRVWHIDTATGESLVIEILSCLLKSFNIEYNNED